MNNPTLNILAFDPSLRNWGWVKCSYNVNTKDILHCSTGVIQTKHNKNPGTYTNQKDVIAATELSKGVQQLLTPLSPKDSLIISETPVGSQSAAAMKSYGVCVGILGSVVSQGYTVKHTRAREVQKYIFPDVKGKISKEDMIFKMKELYPWVFWPEQRSKQEHIADALASLYFITQDKDFNSWVRLKFLLEN